MRPQPLLPRRQPPRQKRMLYSKFFPLRRGGRNVPTCSLILPNAGAAVWQPVTAHPLCAGGQRSGQQRNHDDDQRDEDSGFGIRHAPQVRRSPTFPTGAPWDAPNKNIRPRSISPAHRAAAHRADPPASLQMGMGMGSKCFALISQEVGRPRRWGPLGA